MVIRNLDFVSISGLPSKTNAILLINSDAVLPSSIPVQSLKAIARRNSQFEKIPHAIDLIEFPPGYPPEIARAGTSGSRCVVSVENVLCAPTPERAYHA